MNDGLGETGAVAIPLGERFDALVQHRFEEAHFDHPVDRFLPRVAAQPADFRRELEEPMHRHVRISGRIFRQVADEASWTAAVLCRFWGPTANRYASPPSVSQGHVYAKRPPRHRAGAVFFHQEVADGDAPAWDQRREDLA